MAVAVFDGTGDYIDLELVDVTGAFTYAIVMKRGANNTWDGLVTHQTAADDARLSLALRDSNEFQIAAHNGTSEAAQHSGSAGTGTTFTVLAAEGWVLLVFAKAAGSDAGRLSKFAGGSWTHREPSSSIFATGTASGGKIRLGRYENTDDFVGRIAAVALWNGTEMNQTQVESLDGGDAVAWESVAGGYTDLVEPGMDGASGRANWSAALPSRNGLMDGTAFGGNGTIATGDDPGATVYTVGVVASSVDATVEAPPMTATGTMPSVPEHVLQQAPVMTAAGSMPDATVGVATSRTVVAPVMTAAAVMPSANVYDASEVSSGGLSRVPNVPTIPTIGRRR